MKLPNFIKSLLSPEKYDDHPQKIELKQTHISYVLISNEKVYKIKKPVNFGFLDFTTLEKRKFYCEQEIKLNSRLTPEIYENVIEIKKKGNDYFYDNEGETVDYAVVMKKFSENKSLLNLLKNKSVNNEIFDNVVEKLIKFHEKYPAPKELAEKSIQNMKITTDENFSQTMDYIGITIDEKIYNSLKEYTENFYDKYENLMKKRIEENKIRECHGDLHLQHIIIDDGKILIIDCIEFNDRFRIIDVANEIAFLSMDLDFNGFKDFSEYFVKKYIEESKDYEIELLLNFYKVYRAYVRGKVISFLISDLAIKEREKEKIKNTAKKYFELAYSYIQ